MPKFSAGLLLFRKVKTVVEVFLVHPGGPFWAKKDLGAWSIPKGEYSETEDSFGAAKREFNEETGFPAPEGKYVPLGEVKYGNKRLTAWAVEADVDATKVKSNFFEMPWPPKSGNIQQFPEVDKAEWFTLSMAKRKLVVGQILLIENLQKELHIHDDAPQEPAQLDLF